MIIHALKPGGLEAAGYIPEFLSDADPRPVAAQFNENYAHGGGWRPHQGFSMDAVTHVLHYPEDPPFRPLCEIMLRDETVYVYQYGIVAIVQKDGSFEAARMD